MTLKDLISERQYAEIRGVCVRTIQRERMQRVGPPFIKLGRNIKYRPEAIDEWVLAQEHAQPRASK